MVLQELRATAVRREPTSWTAQPAHLGRVCDGAIQGLTAQPADTPSLRLLADQTQAVLAGVSQAIKGLALLVDDPARSVVRRQGGRLHVPDFLPACVNAARAFFTIGAAALFRICTEWPNGSTAMVFATVGTLLLALRADQAYAAAVKFMVGASLIAAIAATVKFAVLPGTLNFAGSSIAIGLVLIPIGAMTAQPWQTAIFTPMAVFFLPLLAPADPMSYDTQQFYNATLAIVAGLGAAALSFRLLPPLPPALRAR